MNNLVKVGFRRLDNLTVDPFVDDGTCSTRRRSVVHDPWIDVGRCFDNVGVMIADAADKEMGLVR